MTINNKEAYFASLWDWGFLNNCFGDTRIRVTDLDGLIERNRAFLVLETKLPNVSIPTGQQRTISAFRETGLFTIFIVWGHPGDPNKNIPNCPEKVRIYTKRQEINLSIGCELELMKLVGAWYDIVDTPSTGLIPGTITDLFAQINDWKDYLEKLQKTSEEVELLRHLEEPFWSISKNNNGRNND